MELDGRRRVLMASYTWLTFDPPLLNLGRLLSAKGYKVLAIGISRKGDVRREEPAQGFVLKRVSYQRTDSAYLKIKQALRYAVKVVRNAATQRPTCYIATNWNSFLACVFSQLVVRAPILYYQLEYHGRTDAELATASLSARLALKLERCLIRRAQSIFSAEPSRSALMREDYRLSYTPPAILNAPLRSASIGRINRQDQTGRLRIVYAGSIGEKTCIDVLLQALVTHKVNAAIDLFGITSPTFAERFEELLNAAQSRGNLVSYKGWVPYSEIPELMASYQLGIAFYRAENLNQYHCSPCKLFEYMAAGLAVLASDSPGVRSILGPSDLGLCVDAEDVSAVGNALIDLTWRPLRAIKEMGQRARRVFLETFAFERQSEPLVREIEHL